MKNFNQILAIISVCVVLCGGCTKAMPDVAEPTVDYSTASWADVCRGISDINDSTQKAFAVTRSIGKK